MSDDDLYGRAMGIIRKRDERIAELEAELADLRRTMSDDPAFFVEMKDQTKAIIELSDKLARSVVIWEDCGTCGGNGFHPEPTFDPKSGMPDYAPCPDCIDGRVLRDGVRRSNWAGGYVVPAEMVEVVDA